MSLKFYPDNATKIAELEHASMKRAMSFNVKFNYFIGGWGYGKTYGIKSFLFRKFVKWGHTFVWLRKTDEALKQIRSTDQFFGRMGDVINELGITEYHITGNRIYINNKIAGYFAPISTTHNNKGADYKVKYGVFDEFLREMDERPVNFIREKFLRCLESFGRDEIERVFLLSNAVNQYDPMLIHLNIKLNEFGCYLYREKNSVVHYMRPSKAYFERKTQGTVGETMTAAQMAQAYSNKFEQFDVFSTAGKLTYSLSIIIDNNRFLSFYVGKDGFMYVKDGKPDNAKLLTFNKIYVNDKIGKISNSEKMYLKSLFNTSRMKFETGYCRDAFVSQIA